jgi:hypothetical protein
MIGSSKPRCELLEEPSLETCVFLQLRSASGLLLVTEQLEDNNEQILGNLVGFPEITLNPSDDWGFPALPLLLCSQEIPNKCK